MPTRRAGNYIIVDKIQEYDSLISSMRAKSYPYKVKVVLEDRLHQPRPVNLQGLGKQSYENQRPV